MGDGPAGLMAINKACHEVYPDQHNPLQATALVKYWLGGPDPLDYISMYCNHGDMHADIPPHWHYITYGFSDLHGDGRVHVTNGEREKSGFGFELTFRLVREGTESVPPTWPAALLQSIAHYVFTSKNVLCVGDHISWHAALDGSGDSRIQHMLLTADSQLKPLNTKLGQVIFIQVVGVTEEELNVAQRWNCSGVLSLLKKHSNSGGQLLVTNMRRGECLFDLDADSQGAVDKGITEDGSDLSGVSAVCSWEDSKGHPGASLLLEGRVNSSMSNGGVELELTNATRLDAVHMKFNLEAASLLPLAIRGRLKHGRHFTYKSFAGDIAITLVGQGVEGAFATEQWPLAAHGPWLQVFLGEQYLDKTLHGLEKLLAENESSCNLSSV